jgi:hypothetical protein
MKYLLLDTNIYLHYRDFEQINWSKIVDCYDFAILVPRMVIGEIDKHKDGPKSKLKNRARAVSSKFAEYFLETRVQKKVNLIDIDYPSKELMSTNNLKFEINDDVIIGSALSFSNKEDIIVISTDNTLLIKAKSHGFKYLRGIPEEYLISEEKTEEEKELERLKKEVESYKNRQPLPKLTFEDGKTELRFKRPKLYDVRKVVENKMIYLKLEHPYETKEEKVLDNKVTNPFLNVDFFNLVNNAVNAKNMIFSQKHIDTYNKELDEYFEDSRIQIALNLRKENLDKQIQELKFFIHNKGTSETGSMNIVLEFPGNIKLYNSESYTLVNYKEPEKPRLGIAKTPKFSYMDYNDTLCMKLWDLEKSLQSSNFSINANSLIHNVICKLDINNSVYIDTEQCGNFSIKWCICSANCIEPSSGILNVIIE